MNLITQKKLGLKIDIDTTKYPIKHIISQYKAFYFSNNAYREKTRLSHMVALYELNNKVGMIILGGIIRYENLFKEFLATELGKINSNMKFDNSWIKKPQKASSEESIIKAYKKYLKNNKKSLNGFIDGLMFSQLRTILRNFPSLRRAFNTAFKIQDVGLWGMNKYRNKLAHGGALSDVIIDKYTKKKAKLVKVLKSLFKVMPKLKNEIESYISEYNFDTLNLDLTKIIIGLKIQGTLDYRNWSKIIDREDFRQHYEAFNFPTLKKIKNATTVQKNQYTKMFGKTKSKQLFKGNKINENIKMEINKNFIAEYKNYLLYKITTGLATKQERLINLILHVSKNQKISRENINVILISSFIDKARLVKILKTFKIRITSKGRTIESIKGVEKAKLINAGFHVFKKNYLVNRNGEVLKEVSQFPFYKKIKPVINGNNSGRKELKVSINSKYISLHRVVAEVFVPNHKHYKYVGLKKGTATLTNFKASDLMWKEVPRGKKKPLTIFDIGKLFDV